jgi:hypothetical protein
MILAATHRPYLGGSLTRQELRSGAIRVDQEQGPVPVHLRPGPGATKAAMPREPEIPDEYILGEDDLAEPVAQEGPGRPLKNFGVRPPCPNGCRASPRSDGSKHGRRRWVCGECGVKWISRKMPEKVG